MIKIGNLNFELGMSMSPEAMRKSIYQLLSISLIGVLLAACNPRVSSDGVTVDRTTTGFVTEIDVGDAKHFSELGVNSPYMNSRGIDAPANFYVKVTTPESIAKICDPDSSFGGLIHGCTLSDGAKQLGIVESISGPEQDVLMMHELFHAILLDQARTDDTMSNLKVEDIELYTRYMVLNHALYKYIEEKQLSVDPQAMSDLIRTIIIKGDMRADMDDAERFLYKALEDSAGVRQGQGTASIPKDMARYIVSRMQQETTNPNTSSGKAFSEAEYSGLLQNLLGDLSYEDFIKNYSYK